MDGRILEVPEELLDKGRTTFVREWSASANPAGPVGGISSLEVDGFHTLLGTGWLVMELLSPTLRQRLESGSRVPVGIELGNSFELAASSDEMRLSGWIARGLVIGSDLGSAWDLQTWIKLDGKWKL